MKKLLCRQNWKPRLPTAHKVDDFQAVGLAEHGLGKMLAGQNFSIAFNHHPCCVMPARGQQIGHAARCSKGFGFPVDCDIHTRLQKKTATGVFSQFEGVMACGDAGRQKNTRKTITAAGEHNPAKSRLGQLPFVGTIRVRCRIAFFCAILGVRALSPFLSLLWLPQPVHEH